LGASRRAIVLAALAATSAAPAYTRDRATADQVFAQNSKSVGRIRVLGIDPFEPFKKVSYSIGTVFVDAKGTMVTNYHVLLNHAAINVSLAAGQSYRAEYIAGDPILDIAIIKVGDSSKPLAFSSDDPRRSVSWSMP
jgi:S1-C subfamily serine protease